MSALPNTSTPMEPATRNGHLPERESFRKFFESWIVEQNQHLQELVSASRDHEHRQRHNGRTQAADDQDLRALVERVVLHYEAYYRAKSRWAHIDVLSMFNPSWRSSLEDAFLWIAGWRPTMAFHLLYSKSGLQMEARLDELIHGLRTGDLGDLSPAQLERVDLLQRETIKEEKEITEKLAKQQETVADASMVELTHTVTEMMREGVQPPQGAVDAALAPKEQGMVGILQMADNLRLRTLKKVIEVLSPIQGVYFLIAAAELHLRVHEWGKKRDAVNHAGEGGVSRGRGEE